MVEGIFSAEKEGCVRGVGILIILFFYRAERILTLREREGGKRILRYGFAQTAFFTIAR